MTMTVFIDGAVGTTGLEIAERLAGRNEFSLVILPEEKRKDDAARREALNDSDIVILCLPDDAAKQAVAMIANDRTKVIDASSAHRVAPGWTYGFAEMARGQRAAIAATRRLTNPGCYPTGFLGFVAPLVAAGLLPADHYYSVNAVSGYSGGGKALIERFGRESDIGFRAYGLSLNHKHVPEMTVHAGLAHAPLFAPSVIRAFRGMVVEVPLHLAALPKSVKAGDLRDALAAHYADEPLVSVHQGALPDELLLSEGDAPFDGLKLYVAGDDADRQVRLIAVLDNLGKGASGAAVQNLNIMTGVPELTGLRL